MSTSEGRPGHLTGRWVGHYVQRDQTRGISARFYQSGEELSGWMRDAQTVFEQSVFEMAVDGGLPPGEDERILAQLRQQFPEEGAAPVRAVNSLPEASVLSGHVRGAAVYFLKTYQGEAFSGCQVGRRRVGVSVSNHHVHYAGKLSDDGNALEGTWWIDAQAEHGGRRAEGIFLLRREDEA